MTETNSPDRGSENEAIKKSLLLVCSRLDFESNAAAVKQELELAGITVLDANDELGRVDTLIENCACTIVIASPGLKTDPQIKDVTYKVITAMVEKKKRAIPLYMSGNKKDFPGFLGVNSGINWDGTGDPETSYSKDKSIAQIKRLIDQN